MRRTLFVAFLTVAATTLFAAQRPSTSGGAPPAAAPAPMLTVDSIMRGPKLVGTPPSVVRWSKGSDKVYFSWQKAADPRSSTYVVNRDGTGLRALSTEEARTLDLPQNGRFDRARRRLLSAENGDIIVYDTTTSARRFLTRTAGAESAPRWIRNDTAVTFMRDGNLFLVSLDGAGEIPFAQLTDVVTSAIAAPASASAAGAATAGQARGGGAGRGGAAGQATGGDTEAQRLLREQERNLIDFIRLQIEQREATTGRGGRGGRGGDTGGPATPPPIPRFTLGARQTLADLQLSADERYVWIGVSERPDGTARGQETPNYVTESAYPEMIPGRSNVGDVQPRRLLAVLDLKENKSVWADASAFAGSERKAKPADPDAPRLLNWSAPESSDDGSRTVITVRSLDNKDRWFVKVDPATGKATVLDGLHDEAWIREGTVRRRQRPGIAWLPDNRRFLFLSEKTGYMHLYSLDVTASAPAAKALTSGKWEVTSAQLSSDRKTMFLQTNEVHPGERHFYTMSVDGGARTKLTSTTGSHDVDRLARREDRSRSSIPTARSRPSCS